MRDLAVQSANGGSQDEQSQKAANKEFGELKTELTRIAQTTSFGSQKLLDGNYNGTFQVGSNGDDANERISINLTTAGVGDLTGTGLVGTAELVDSTPAGGTAAARIAENVTASQAAIESLDTAISKVSDVRAQLGATQNRFEHTINNLNVSIENLSA
uniref:flagellin N-terminal helical domain-containing protein n=1 Tax=Spirillospora albida TaxID=58123 RepID=UPI002480CB22